MSYNLSMAKGPNPLTTNVNSQFTVPSDNVWIQVAAGCVWPIMPGVALLYAGLSRGRVGSSLIFTNFMCWGVSSISWYLMGYSLCTGVDGGPFIGSFFDGGFKNVQAGPSPGAPDLSDPVYSIFQCYFCVATVCIMIGGGNERARMWPTLVLAAFWSVLVYCFVAYWTWNANGWLYTLGELDFAGGNVVHVAAGFGSLAFALFLGKRRGPNGTREIPKGKPSDTVLVFLGTSLIYFGWMFFNSGTALNGTVRSNYAFVNTNLAACSAMLTYVIMHYFRNSKRWSVIAACEGVIAGLVGITPAAGFVPFHFAVVTGILTAAVCNLTENVTRLVGIDEGLEVFNLHGIGGICGSFCTAFFAADYIAALDGATVIDGGWIQHNWIQLGYNLAGTVSIAAWSFVVTIALLLLMNWIPGLRVRISAEEEDEGYDLAIMEEQLGEDPAVDLISGISTHFNEQEDIGKEESVSK